MMTKCLKCLLVYNVIKLVEMTFGEHKSTNTCI